VRLRHKINAIYLQNVPLKSHNQAVKMKKEMVRNEEIAESDMRRERGRDQKRDRGMHIKQYELVAVAVAVEASPCLGLFLPSSRCLLFPSVSI